MRLESGPLSAVLDAKEVREAAAPFVRLLVRVPEAYPLLGPYEATRPGLLVLDADGRRVDALALKEDSDPAAVAKWLRGALEAPARERVVMRTPSGVAEALAKSLARVEGVARAEVGENEVVVLVRPGTLLPIDSTSVEVLEPAPVSLRSLEAGDLLVSARALAAVPGVWSVVDRKEGLRAWVTRLLLDPAAMKKALPALDLDVEERRYALPGVSQGPPAMKIAPPLLALPGILTLRPALASESLSIVGRKGVVDWAAVLKALRGAVPDAKEKP